MKSGTGIPGSTGRLSHVRAFAASRLVVLLPLLVAGCVGAVHAPPEPFGPWPRINGGSSWFCATGRNGWRLSTPGLEEGPESEAFQRRVEAEPSEAVALARSLLSGAPDDERITFLLWALKEDRSEAVIDLCWDVLVRVSWDERSHAGSFASLILQLRIGHHAEAERRNATLTRLIARAQSPEDRANLGFLAWRQGRLDELPPCFTAEFAHAALHDRDRFPLPREFVVGSGLPPGNLRVWKLLMLAGGASVPLLAEDLLCSDRDIRAGAQWCVERILLTSLKDMGWDYSPDMTPEQLEKLRQDGLVGDIRRQAR